MLSVYLIPVGIVTGIGAIAGVILTVASKVMAVKVNEAVIKVREALPGANCGACGFAGCDDYAQALANDHTIKTNLCPPGGSKTALEISKILGIAFETVVGQYARVRCSGTCDKTSYVMEFRGMNSCSANKMFYRGRGACYQACLGYGDCAHVCGYGAISIVDGVAVVDKKKCVGCSMCVSRCPSNLIEVVPSTSNIYVKCSSEDKGAETRKVCKAGCIACKKCEKTCAFDAIKVDDNVAKIDIEKCTNCGACIDVCPVNVIVVSCEGEKALVQSEQ